MVSPTLPARYTFRTVHATGSHGLILCAVGPDGILRAIKTVDPAGPFPPGLFGREIDIQASLNLPGIIPVLDRWNIDGVEAMAMPWLPERLSDRVLLKPALALDLVCKLGRTLELMHSAEVIHRDITPGNILFSSPESREPWLADFGLAVRKGETDVPDIRPTPEFGMVAGGDPWDTRQDTHGLAASAWYAITGSAPGPAPSWRSLTRSASQAGNPVPVSLARRFSHWLKYPSMARDMVIEAQQLKNGLGDNPGEAKPTQTLGGWISGILGLGEPHADNHKP